jgi:hypothetical protein
MSALPPGVSNVQAREELPGRYLSSYIDAGVPPDQDVPPHVDAAVCQVIAQTSFLYFITPRSKDAAYND